jgi:hypothetical protein
VRAARHTATAAAREPARVTACCGGLAAKGRDLCRGEEGPVGRLHANTVREEASHKMAIALAGAAGQTCHRLKRGVIGA